MRLIAAVAILASFAACGSPPAREHRRPSFLLAVLDTTRMDAVSAYGHVRGTTPAIDALAAAGLRYEHAYAQSSWTLPSHATLFTGLPPRSHGVDWQRSRAADELVMLAEVFRDAGYDTAAFSENVWITRHFNMTQGFGHDVWATGETLLPSLDAWLAGRTGDRPFLVFVNIVDAHSPYTVRPANAHLPPGATAEDAKRIPQSEETYFCNRDADPRALDVLRGLYLGDVAAADAKLAAVRARLEPRAGASPLVTVVTSDHGEAFGEHALYGHLVGLHEVLLRVPLVVHGLPGTSPATIDVPVPLGNLAPSILGWADLAVPAAMGGTPVAVARGGPAAGSPFVADWYDPLDDAEPAAPSSVSPDGDIARLVPEAARGLARRVRARCTPEQRAFGARHAFFQWPRKLIAYDAGPAELYDVVADPGERRDLAATERALVRELVAGHARFVAPAPPAHAGGGAGAAPRDQRDVLENLKALGYIDD